MSSNVISAVSAVSAILAGFGEYAEPIEGKDCEVMIKSDAVKSACEYLLSVGYEFLSDITAVDYPDRGVFRLLYQVANYENGDIVTLKTEISRDSAEISSVDAVWRAADWLEREVYDMFGIKFTDHPNMKRILMWEGFEGWPLRKDFVHKPTKYQGRRNVD